MNKINEKQADKTARAKRADLDAMQERFDAILKIVRGVDGTDRSMTADHALKLIGGIASGQTLDNLIMQAGRAALGLE